MDKEGLYATLFFVFLFGGAVGFYLASLLL